MTEYIKKSDVLEILKLPQDLIADYVYELKGVWLDEAEQTEPQLTQKCPFDDSLPCEWVCTEYGKCKYKPQTERSE